MTETTNEDTKQENRPSELNVGIGAGGAFRWVGVDVTDVTRAAQQRLDLGPVASIAFGRCAAAAAMLLRLTSKAPRRLILDIRGSGPLRRVLVEVGKGGSVRGLVGEPHATGPEGILDLSVADAVGIGLLRVRKEEGRVASAEGSSSDTDTESDLRAGTESRVTYESQVELSTSEIGSDVAYYLQQSEQRRCAIAVGVEVGTTGIRSAAGFLVEALPGADDAAVASLEAGFHAIDPISKTYRRLGSRGIAKNLFPDARLLFQHGLEYRCRCSGERLADQLAAMPATEIAALSDDGVVKAECAYCGEIYHLSELDLLQRGGDLN